MYHDHFSIINNSLIQTSLITAPPIFILINYKLITFFEKTCDVQENTMFKNL